MSGTGFTSALAVLREAIAALTGADAARLERLAAEAGDAVVRAEEQEAAREEYASLALLLALTRRNLGLLRGEHCGMYGRH
jgi:hypothetical protein